VEQKYTPKKVKRVRLNQAYTQSQAALKSLFEGVGRFLFQGSLQCELECIAPHTKNADA
jgi:hypothetical protein